MAGCTSAGQWSLFILAMVVTAATALVVLTIDAYRQQGRIVSISEMLVNTHPAKRSEVTAAIMIAALGIVVAYTTTYKPVPPAYSRLAALEYAIFCVAIGAIQIVVAITYRLLMWLHFTAAAVFFVSAALSLSLDAYIDVRTRSEHRRPSLRRTRTVVKVVAATLVRVHEAST